MLPPVVGLSFVQRGLKRMFDLASVLVILALFWWAIIGVAVAVRLTTGSPVIYGHRRIGRDGREFQCYKFRSMVPNADEVLAQLLVRDASARAEWARDFKLKCDPRITRVGRFIRKTSLDEFPQLWNVIVNDMSIVGPRPVVRKELDQHYQGVSRAHYLSVKPGLTGLWQVSGRNDMEYRERVELDRRYVTGWGLWSDFMIVMRTVGVVFRRKGGVLIMFDSASCGRSFGARGRRLERRRADSDDARPPAVHWGRARDVDCGHGPLASLCIFALLLFPATAHAYLDPGSGSLVFQSLLALLFGLGASWRRLRTAAARLFFWLRGRRSRRDSD